MHYQLKVRVHDRNSVANVKPAIQLGHLVKIQPYPGLACFEIPTMSSGCKALPAFKKQSSEAHSSPQINGESTRPALAVGNGPKLGEVLGREARSFALRQSMELPVKLPAVICKFVYEIRTVLRCRRDGGQPIPERSPTLRLIP